MNKNTNILFLKFCMSKLHELSKLKKIEKKFFVAKETKRDSRHCITCKILNEICFILYLLHRNANNKCDKQKPLLINRQAAQMTLFRARISVHYLGVYRTRYYYLIIIYLFHYFI